MASVASQLIEEVTAHAQSDSLEDARERCADGTYFPNNLRIPPVLTQPVKKSVHWVGYGMCDRRIVVRFPVQASDFSILQSVQ